MIFLHQLRLATLAALAAADHQHSHALNKVPSISLDNFDDEDVHWEVEYLTETHYPPAVTQFSTVYYTPPSPVTVYATFTSVSVITAWATVTQFASITQYAPPVTVSVQPQTPKHAFNGDAIVKHRPQHMQEFSLNRPDGPIGKAVYVTTTIMDSPPTQRAQPPPRNKVVKAHVLRAPCSCGSGSDSGSSSNSGCDSRSSAGTGDTGSATVTSDDWSDFFSSTVTTTGTALATDDPGSGSDSGSDSGSGDSGSGCSCGAAVSPTSDNSSDSPCTTDSDPEPCITTAATCDGDDGDAYQPAQIISRPRCGQQYDHEYGDDAIDFVLDTKDHARERLYNSKERAKEALSHVRPGHIHDRIGQVLHDDRPEMSIRHHRKHSRSRKNMRNNIRHIDGCGCALPPPVKAPCTPPPPPVKAPCAPPVKAPCAPPVKAPCAPPPVKAPCVPPVKAPCAPPVKAPRAPIRAPCGADFEREHQYGDDTMNFVLNTKDHVRSRWGSFKERAKSALSHFTPGHIHDRTSQLLHDDRPEMSDEHTALHARKGRAY